MIREDPIKTATVGILRAFRALKDGLASAEQQKIVLNYIVHNISDIGALPYVENSFDKTSYNLGIQAVGQMIMTLATNETILNDRIAKEKKHD
jgi:hypothetical protein